MPAPLASLLGTGMHYLPPMVLLWLAIFFGRTLRPGRTPLQGRTPGCDSARRTGRFAVEMLQAFDRISRRGF